MKHRHFVEALLEGLDRRGMRVDRAQYAVSHQGLRLFGTLLFGDGEDYERSLAFRASNDKTFPLQIMAGISTFVCDNLALSGDVVALKRKHTSGLNLTKEVAAGIDGYLLQQELTEKRIARAPKHLPQHPSGQGGDLRPAATARHSRSALPAHSPDVLSPGRCVAGLPTALGLGVTRGLHPRRQTPRYESEICHDLGIGWAFQPVTTEHPAKIATIPHRVLQHPQKEIAS